MNRLSKIITFKGIIAAIVFGLLALLIIYSKIHFNIPGTNMLTDPRELFVLIGAALTGPVGGIIIGILASISDPTPGLIYYVMAQHIVGAVFIGYFYKKTRNQHLNILYHIFVWVILVLCYYSVFYMPVYYITYFFFPSTYKLITIIPGDPTGAIIIILKGWIPEFIFTSVTSSIVLLSLTDRSRTPIWGNPNTTPFPNYKKEFFLFRFEIFRNNIWVRMSLWFLLFTLVPILIIAVFVTDLMKESVLRTEADQILANAQTSAFLIAKVPAFPQNHYQTFELNGHKYFVILSETREDNDIIRGNSFVPDYLTKIDSLRKLNKKGTYSDVVNNLCLGYSRIDEQRTCVTFSGPNKFKAIMLGVEWLSGRNLFFGLILLSCFGGFIIWIVIARPLKKLKSAAEAVSHGDYSVQINTADMDDDIALLSASFNNMVSSIKAAQNKLILETEKSLKTEKEKYIFATELKRISDNILDVIIKTSTDGVILFTNPAIYKTFAYSEKEIISEYLKNFVHPVDIETFNSKFDVLVKKQMSVKFQFRFINKDGSSVYVEIIGSPLTNEVGVTTSLIFTLRDITSIKEIEDSLKKAKEEAEKSNQLKTDFLAQMSHEIRTPINSILSFSRLIKDEVQDRVSADINYSFTAIENSSQRLIRTIESLLNFSQLLRKNYDVTLEEIDLYNILGNLEHEFSIHAKNKSLQLVYSNNCKDCKIISDKYITQQIAANLIDNAIKYTQHGSVEIYTERIEDRVVLKIIDTGKGMAQDYLRHLFEPFSQEETGYNRRFEGNGLGLAIVKEYCSLIGAEIKVESEKGVGSTFTIIFYKIVH